ncbi:DUF2691 family protein [Clostridium taeniosporum]|nr:DUF2691 family protein [Clostridium taeniosporum]
MRGISFKVDDRDEHILWTILRGIEIENLWWHISEDEVYNDINESIFKNSYIKGEGFLEIIQEKSYTVISANIKAYPPNSVPNHIENYDEFIKSKCKIVILCSDVFYYEIYVDDSSVIETLKSNVIKGNISDLEYITEENDARTSFSVI